MWNILINKYDMECSLEDTEKQLIKCLMLLNMASSLEW